MALLDKVEGWQFIVDKSGRLVGFNESDLGMVVVEQTKEGGDVNSSLIIAHPSGGVAERLPAGYAGTPFLIKKTVESKSNHRG